MISLVVLAAGMSTRFEGNKMLYPIKGEPMVRRVVKTALSSKVDEVIVVLGFEAPRVREAVKDLGCKIVENPEYATGGQSSSVRCGVRAINQDAEAVMILPGDVAFIEPNVIDMVAEHYRRSRAKIVVASHNGRSGHPILLDRSLIPEILQIDEEGFGLKAVINRHRRLIEYVEAGTCDVLLDIDRNEDLSRRRGV